MQRFNFLDLFGYLIPGAVLLVLLWMPYGLTTGVWPTSELLSGVLALGVAYVLGHVLQGLAHFAFPSKDSTGRYPSDWLLDDQDKRAFPAAVRQVLSLLVAKRFGICVRGNGLADEGVRYRRASIFHLCRGALIQKGVAGYVEQYQGMYFLTRGLAAAFALSATYLAGLALANSAVAPPPFWIIIVAAIAAFAVPPLLVRFGLGPVAKFLDKWWLWGAGSLLLVGGALNVRFIPKEPIELGMMLGSLLAAFFAYRCRQSSVEFQSYFARAVYQDFIALETSTPRNLFAELTAQRAFAKWLVRDPSSASAAADWEAAEAELKAELTRNLPA